MICIILVAGHGVLEKEIQEDRSGAYSHLIGIPKALLPTSTNNGNTILDLWWNALKSRQQFSKVYLVTNAAKYKHYERWATAHDFPLLNIINDGTTTTENSIGAIADLDLAIRTKKVEDDIMVVAGDMVFSDNFYIEQVIDFFKRKQADLVIYYRMLEGEPTEKRGIVEVDQTTGKITRFLEKPRPHQTTSRLASPSFYCLRRETLEHISSYTQLFQGVRNRALGMFMSWLVSRPDSEVYGMNLPTRFDLIGLQVGLEEYKQWITWFQTRHLALANTTEPITCRTYARIGLMGNPSDGFYGKTISLSIANFWAEVTIMQSARLKLSLHPLNDPTEFGSLSDLYGISRKEGYLGGLRLIQATCKKFHEFCAEHGIALARKNFTLKYDTNIPRQVGLAGSSAVIISTLKCLMKFYGLTEASMPKKLQSYFVLDVERTELFIQGGLQDRVIQVFQGLMYMNFDKAIMDKNYGKFGEYEHMDVSKLPPLWLAYPSDPSDSGEQKVIDAMKHFADLTDQAKSAIEEGDFVRLSALMDENFETRRSIYGDRALGAANLQMIQIARKHGSSAKFCGSGGAVVGLCQDEKSKLEMIRELQEQGFVCCTVQPFNPSNMS